MSPPPDLESAAAALFAGPREAFIAARNGLAKQAKAAGDAGLAARITALAKPSATAWAIDRVWWTTPERVEVLFDAAAELRAALLAGVGTHGADAVRTRHRQALAAATVAALGHLPGTAATPATRRRISTTLEALAALGRWPPPGPGCLGEDLDPPGFEAHGGLPEVTPSSSEPGAPGEAGANDSDRARVEQAIAAARVAAARLAVCREQHDALVAAHQAAILRLDEAAAALSRARVEHDACAAAELACARDLEQRKGELEDASDAHAAASAALDALRPVSVSRP